MGVPFVIIDGYNLLHAAGLARLRYAPGDLERARQRLLGMLCEKLQSTEQVRCTIVFDGQAAPSDGLQEQRHKDLRVLFATVGSDADTVIEELIDHHPAPRQTIVVSADHRLHKAARRRGASPIDSEDFWERLQKRVDARNLQVDDLQRPARPKATPRKSESEAWLVEFGQVSVEEIAAEVQAEAQSVKGGTPWEREVSDLEQILNDPQQLERFVRDPRRRAP